MIVTTPHFNISFRHGSRRVYACDVNRYQWEQKGRYGYYKSTRIATIPMDADVREDHATPSYADKLRDWHERLHKMLRENQR